MKCEKCKFWEKNINEPEEGLCRKNAPCPLVSEDLNDHDLTYVDWPRTFSEDWCGGYQKKTSKK